MYERWTFYDVQSINRRRTFFLITAFFAILMIAGFALDYFYMRDMRLPFFTMIALCIAVFQSLIAYYAGDKIVLRSVGARPADPRILREKVLIDVVEELTIASGLPMPKVYVIPDSAPNAFATGRDPQHASVAATEGLLNMLTREELQGVMAHELSHVKNRDILVMTLVSALAGALVIMAHFFWRTLFWRGIMGGRRDSRSGGGNPLAIVIFIIGLILIILAPIIGRLLALAVSRSREYLADASAAEMTRNPLALARALEKIPRFLSVSLFVRSRSSFSVCGGFFTRALL